MSVADSACVAILLVSAVTRKSVRTQAPYTDRPEYAECERLAEQLADLLAPQSGAYYDIWLDGEKFVSSQMEVCCCARCVGAMVY